MKKIAICLYGLSIGFNDKNEKVVGIKESMESIKKYVGNDMEQDFFFHTWIEDSDIESKNKVLDIYKPKNYIIENRIKFKNNCYNFHNYTSVKSRWLSHLKTIDLCNSYSNENNIEYNIVFIVRFDCVFTRNLKLNELDIKDYVYVSGWDKNYNNEYFNKHGYMDFWWFGNLHMINKFKNVYDNIENSINKRKKCSNHLISFDYLKDNNIPVVLHCNTLGIYDGTRKNYKI